MALAVPRYTVRDLDALPNDGNRYELLDGLLLVTPAPAPGHQAVVSRLVLLLGEYFSRSGALVYLPGAGEREPKVHLEPDILKVHLEPDILVVPPSEPIAKRWSEICNWWLAVEVSGRGSRVYDRDFKFAAYTALGVRDVWRVDLKDRCVVVKSDTKREHVYREHFAWNPTEVDNSLAIDVRSLFDGVEED